MAGTAKSGLAKEDLAISKISTTKWYVNREYTSFYWENILNV